MTFPLERHPGAVVFVDDDSTYLEVIGDIVPTEWTIERFSDARHFVDHMRAKMAMSKEIDAYQRGAIDRYKRNGSAASEILRYWNSFPERYSLPQVAIIDSRMPTGSGLDALAGIKDWGGQRILFTGVADEASVCRAFNEHAIDYYIPKQSPKILQQIVSTVNIMRKNVSGTRALKWDAWHMSMKTEQMLMLQMPEVTSALFDFVGDDCEHVVIGSPFGAMALGYAGGARWLQLETTSTLAAAADLALRFGATDDQVQSIRAGQGLTDARINAALNIDEKANVTGIRFQLRVPHINEVLYGAVFEMPAAGGVPAAEMCYAAWHARHLHR